MSELLGTARRGLFELYRLQRTCAWVEATGTSMLPSIETGTRLLVEFGAPEPLVGEIAVFPLRDKIVVHRVVRRRPGTLICKGDARLEFDPPVPLGSVLGTVRALRRPGQEDDGDTELCSGPRAVALARSSAAVGAVTARLLAWPAPVRRPGLKAVHSWQRVAAWRRSRR
jgi:Peptidase S24-like